MDVEKCVSLHNAIAALHAASPYLHPTTRLQRNFFTAFGPAAASLRPRLRGAVIPFLENTDYFIRSHSPPQSPSPNDDDNNTTRVVHNPSLTPHLLFPHPSHLFAFSSFPVPTDPVQSCLATDIVCLYRSIGDAESGGLFLDLDSARAHWISLDSMIWPLPRPGAWVPLEEVLGRYLGMWRGATWRLVREVGAPEESEGCAVARPWGEGDFGEGGGAVGGVG